MTNGDWTAATLGELTENFDFMRVPVKEADRKPGPYPYYGASGIVDHVDGYLFEGEYLLIAEDGENLRTRQTPVAFLARGRFWVNNHAHIVRGNHRADTRFLMYALAQADISGYLTGSTMPKLTQANLNAIHLRVPPVEEQRQVASVLGSLDDKIEANHRMNRTLEAMARALFRSWFVDFDPVRARADGRLPAGMDAETAALFPERFEDSGLGKIPAGWKVGTVGDLASIHRRSVNPGGTPARVFDHHSIPAFDEGQMPKAEQGRDIKSNKFVIPEGSVLISKLNPYIPRVWLPVLGDRPAICSTEFVVLVPDATTSSREYLFALFTTPEMVSELEQRATGTSNSHQRVNPEDMMGIPCVLPDPRIAKRWVEMVEGLFDKIAANRFQSLTLTALRDALLPKLISGELRVPDAEHLIVRAK
jgi:type I restriction enzyme S subunit